MTPVKLEGSSILASALGPCRPTKFGEMDQHSVHEEEFHLSDGENFHGMEESELPRTFLDKLETLIDNKLKSHSDELKATKQFDFKKKGNKKQFEINSKLTSHLANANRFVSTICKEPVSSSVFNSARRALDEIDSARGEHSLHVNTGVRFSSMVPIGSQDTVKISHRLSQELLHFHVQMWCYNQSYTYCTFFPVMK